MSKNISYKKLFQKTNELLWIFIIGIAFLNILFTFLYGFGTRANASGIKDVINTALKVTAGSLIGFSILAFVSGIAFLIFDFLEKTKSKKIKENVFWFLFTITLSLIIFVVSILDVLSKESPWYFAISNLSIWFYVLTIYIIKLLKKKYKKNIKVKKELPLSKETNSKIIKEPIVESSSSNDLNTDLINNDYHKKELKSTNIKEEEFIEELSKQEDLNKSSDEIIEKDFFDEKNIFFDEKKENK